MYWLTDGHGARIALLGVVCGGCSPEAPAPYGTWERRPAASEPVVEQPAPGEPRAQPNGGLPTPDRSEQAEDRVDVVVVGSGAAGLAAGLAAREAGASVLLLERESVAGQGVTYATRAFAAGTDYQAAAGVEDSPEKAAEEWEEITGVPGDTLAVRAFLEGSAGTLDWVVGYGFAYNGLATDPDSGSVARMHQVRGEDTRSALVAAFDGDLRLNARVDELLLEGGRVRGVRWTDLGTGELQEVQAGAVVVATGGFLRDRARVEAADPSLAGRELLYESGPQADGGGLAFLEAAGVGAVATDSIGIFLHSIQDPERDPGEALIFGAMDRAIFVDEAGLRFASESLSRSFLFFDLAPAGQVFAVFPDAVGARFSAGRPDYNRAEPGVEESFSLAELALLTEDVQVAANLEELATAAGIDPDGLLATVDEVVALTVSDEEDAFGRGWGGGVEFVDDLWWSIRLSPGLAKAFGGVATDVDARALDLAGEPIPGLYAAGEVAGMLPGGGAGTGFSGSILACYHYGRVAGTNAAAFASAQD